MASENAAAQPIVHIVDDDEALRESLEFLLRSAALEVRSFESAKAFLDALPHAVPGCNPGSSPVCKYSTAWA